MSVYDVNPVEGGVNKAGSLEDLYGLEKHEVKLRRARTPSRKYLELFKNPGEISIRIDFPEFTCRCPKTSQPDFATLSIGYRPSSWCVELKSLKYYFNSFRDEGHFHEEVTWLIARDLVRVLKPREFELLAEFNVRGGTYPTIRVAYDEKEGWGS